MGRDAFLVADSPAVADSPLVTVVVRACPHATLFGRGGPPVMVVV